MTGIAFKLICSIAGLFGVFILLFVVAAYFQGFFASLGSGTAALKIIGTVIRAVFLLLCAWAAWKNPHYAALFALGAFFTFVFSGAADEVFRLGLIRGFSNLMPTYYIVVIAHALLATLVWLLTPKISVFSVVG